MKVIFKSSVSEFDGQHHVSRTVERAYVNPDDVVRAFNGLGFDTFDHVEDDGQLPGYVVLDRSFGTDSKPDFYADILAKGAEGYQVLFVNHRYVVLYKPN